MSCTGFVPYSGGVKSVVSELSVDLISSMIPVDPDAAALISSTEIFEERSIPNSIERTTKLIRFSCYLVVTSGREIID
jgi:hypothetical protein